MIKSIAQAVNDCLETVFTGHQSNNLQTQAKLLIAYSGGLDSSVLLHALHLAREKFELSLEAIHVNHQLQKDSLAWSKHCEQQCAQYDIPCHIVEVEIDEKSGQSLEALAREARYMAFNQKMDSTTYLFTAHHADDQFETFLMQFFRGAGPKGLSAMAHTRELSVGKHLRPLLKIERSQLQEYATTQKLDYIDDPSNRNSRFDRNFLRNDIIPKLTQRYPGVKQAVLRSVNHIATEHKVLDRFVHEQLKELSNLNVLNLELWKVSDPDLKSLLLRKWISLNQMQLPSTKVLENISLQLNNSHAESSTCVKWSNVEIRTYRENAYLLNQFEEIEYFRQAGALLKPNNAHQLNHGIGEIFFTCSSSLTPELSLAFRQGGERLREPGHKHHVTIKQMFQKTGVLPWMRSRIPLLFDGEQLVAAGDLWVNADWLEQQDNPDFEVRWDNRPQIFT